MDSKVDSCPPCSVCVEVKTAAGLFASAPESHSALVPSRKNLSGAAMFPKRVGLPRIKPQVCGQILMSGVRRPIIRYRGSRALGDGGERGHGTQPGLHARDRLDAATHLPSQGGGTALA